MRPLYSSDIELTVEMLPNVPDDDAWLALALYREVLGVNSIAYRVLGFLKILNIHFHTGAAQKKYINSAVPFLTDHLARKRLSELKALGTDVAAYLWESCRCAVAHASTKPLVNPDDIDDSRRLNSDFELIKSVAEHCIEFQLGVRSRSTIYREHRYQLDGFKDVIGEAVIGTIIGGKIKLPTSSIRILNVDVRVRGQVQLDALRNMTVECHRIECGKVHLIFHSSCPKAAIILRIGLEPAKETLLFEPVTDMSYAEPQSACLARAAVDFFQLQKQLLVNGILEIYQTGSNRRLSRADPYLPTNLDVRQTIENLERDIAALEERFSLKIVAAPS